MAGKRVAPQSTAKYRDAKTNGHRTVKIHGAVTGAEYRRVDAARQEAEYRTLSECTRTVMLAWADSPTVRAAVKSYRQETAA